jgi:NAD(P)-dependent dehydrogenase (short-subunit alcohol dehydrogenase family)
MIHYGVTKTAQVALARGLAESVAGTGVTVNSVLPGPTASEGVSSFVADTGDIRPRRVRDLAAAPRTTRPPRLRHVPATARQCHRQTRQSATHHRQALAPSGHGARRLAVGRVIELDLLGCWPDWSPGRERFAT